MSDMISIPVRAGEQTSGASVLDVLGRAMEERLVRRSCLAEGAQADPREGLALLEGFLAISDRDIRQALLDAVAILSRRDAV